MHYHAIFSRAADGITVIFPDIPEAMTCAPSTQEAQLMAEDVLLSAVENHFSAKEKFPLARPGRAGESAVFLPDLVYAQILRHNTLLASGLTRKALARAINVNGREINRIFTVRRRAHLDVIAKALAFLGSPLKLSL